MPTAPLPTIADIIRTLGDLYVVPTEKSEKPKKTPRQRFIQLFQ